MANVYERLRQRLDDLATGYPATESGVEIRILRRLFTEEEAEFFLNLSMVPEEPDEVARRLGLELDHTASTLERMAKKGLLLQHKKGNRTRYAILPYVIGIFEFQVKRMDPEFAGDMNEYFETSFGRTIQSLKTPVMRTIPINRKIAAEWPISPYEDVMGILEKQEVIAIAPCICRTWMRLSGKGCDKPLETCFSFGPHAHYYVENHMGRYISQEEARKIVKRNEESGLVMQVFNSQKTGGMCSCCGCCCGMLRSLKKQPAPAASVKSNYYTEVNQEVCIGCEICLDRCQMKAINITDQKATVDLNRCIGCGLCVTTCSSGAMKLIKKRDDQQYQPPKSGIETYLLIAQERGKKLS